MPRPDIRRRLTDEPDPSKWPDLAELRLRQWRRNSHDPFDSEKGGTPNSNEIEASKFEPPKLKHPGSKWVHLFYDLAWAASFASLTGNGKFDNPLDMVNYFLFFIAVLWIWASQTLYSIHFYTNDWFHLFLTFLQLVIFGMLAATTQGYDITTYIVHSPGEPTLVPANSDSLTPKKYAEEKKAHSSILALAIAAIHLGQYLRVIYYAKWAEKKPENLGTTIRNRVPPQLRAVTIGLVISTPMFITALAIAATDSGESVLGASLKLGLWIGGSLVEVSSHLCMSLYWWNIVPDDSVLPVNSDVRLYERLQTVTTIIIGEGINGIAGTLSRVLVAPGTGKIAIVNIVSAAGAIWFIAYIYFEGPKGETDPARKSARYILWLMFHFPFFASIVLLLIGVKHQFLVTSFLSSWFQTVNGFNKEIGALISRNSNIDQWGTMTSEGMERLLIKGGLVWQKEVENLLHILQNSTVNGQPIDPNLALAVWIQRFALTIVVKLFEDFSPDGEVLGSLQQNITAYYESLERVIDDANIIPTNPNKAEYFQILAKLLDGPIQNTRCIIGFAGALLISLCLIDFVHSWPRDWYECGVLISRLLMGLALCSLLLLNLGKYQELFVPESEVNHRSVVFRWLEALWVLPTIAISYGVQFLIEIVLARYAKMATEKAKAQKDELARKQEETQPAPQWEETKHTPYGIVEESLV